MRGRDRADGVAEDMKMSELRKLTQEEEADIDASLLRIMGPPLRPKPARLVCVDGRVVADAMVIVSPKDVNWWRGMAVRRNGEIQVRRQ
jgi:hypothetical protein